MELHKKLVFLSISLALVSATSGRKFFESNIEQSAAIFLGFVSVVSLFFSLLFLCILWLRPSPYHGIWSTFLQLLIALRSQHKGKRYLEEFRQSWKNPRKYQERVLLDILTSNSDTEYGRRFKLKDIRSIEEFRKRHPLTNFDHYRSYLERSMAGEENVMVTGKVDSFLVTSGTTGKSKYIPAKDHRGYLNESLDTIYALTREVCPRSGLLQKQLFHYVAPVNPKTEGGSRVVTAVTLYTDGRMRHCFTTPPAGFQISSLEEANYIHLLFAIREPNIGIIISPFIGAIDTMMKQLKRCWEDIVDDIEQGTVNNKVHLADDVRVSLVAELGGGDPRRAQELRREFERGFDNIMLRIWPHLECVTGIDNSGIWSSFKKKYARDIPLICVGYGCSEGGFLSTAPWLWEEYPHIAPIVSRRRIFEFIKLNETKEAQPKTYLIDEVEIGEDYEVVFTQESGLYRYRQGDIIRFTGRQGNCPVFQFLYRLGLMLNLRYEKMNQESVKAGIQSAFARWSGVMLGEYAVAESTLIPQTSSAFEKDEIMPYYVIFLEVQTASEVVQVSSEQLRMIDDEFRARNSDYERLRREGAISPPRVHIVQPGTFEGLKQFIVANSTTSANQYKVPHKLRTAATFEFMMGRLDNVRLNMKV